MTKPIIEVKHYNVVTVQDLPWQVKVPMYLFWTKWTIICILLMGYAVSVLI